jgi:hypothetical protein
VARIRARNEKVTMDLPDSLTQPDSTSTPDAVVSRELTRRVRVNFSSTLKDGWRYEATIEVQGTAGPIEIEQALLALDTVAKIVGEVGVAVRQRADPERPA